MRVSRLSHAFMGKVSASFQALDPKARISLIGAAIALLLAAAAFLPTPSGTSTAQAQGIVTSKTTPFLTLPFTPTARMSILSGWYYSSSGGFHGGIDYINGTVDHLATWQTFPIIASADGEACGNCTSRQGNAVWIKHNVNGQTYYTYYGHLASIASFIPIGSQSRTVSVKRGQVIGMAGDTGASGILHLHFALYNASSQPVDPYSIGRLREYYPKPDHNPGTGWFVQNPQLKDDE